MTTSRIARRHIWIRCPSRDGGRNGCHRYTIAGRGVTSDVPVPFLPGARGICDPQPPGGLQAVHEWPSQSILEGRTPLPCARCNTEVKFESLVERARVVGRQDRDGGQPLHVDPGRRDDLVLGQARFFGHLVQRLECMEVPVAFEVRRAVGLFVAKGGGRFRG